jgi:hypothetical protein
MPRFRCNLRGKNEGVKPLWNYSLNQKSGTGMVSLIPFWPVFLLFQRPKSLDFTGVSELE